jgi:hypothetical protein
MRRVLGFLIAFFAIFLLSGCSNTTTVIKKPIVIQKRLFIQPGMQYNQPYQEQAQNDTKEPKIENKVATESKVEDKAKKEAKPTIKDSKKEKKKHAKKMHHYNRFAVDKPKKRANACCGNEKKELVLYKDRYKAVAQCPRDVDTVVQTLECEGCAGFEVTVRKNNCCAKNKCDRVKDRK